MTEHHLEIDLVITGGLRVSSDFAKALAMGADAIAIASAALMSAACQQYRICETGKCPVGIATQDLNCVPDYILTMQRNVYPII